MKEFIIGSLKFIKFCFTPDKDKIKRKTNIIFNLIMKMTDAGIFIYRIGGGVTTIL